MQRQTLAAEWLPSTVPKVLPFASVPARSDLVKSCARERSSPRAWHTVGFGVVLSQEPLGQGGLALFKMCSDLLTVFHWEWESSLMV